MRLLAEFLSLFKACGPSSTISLIIDFHCEGFSLYLSRLSIARADLNLEQPRRDIACANICICGFLMFKIEWISSWCFLVFFMRHQPTSCEDTWNPVSNISIKKTKKNYQFFFKSYSNFPLNNYMYIITYPTKSTSQEHASTNLTTGVRKLARNTLYYHKKKLHLLNPHKKDMWKNSFSVHSICEDALKWTRHCFIEGKKKKKGTKWKLTNKNNSKW